MDSLLRTFKSSLNTLSGKYTCIKCALKTQLDNLQQSFIASITQETITTNYSNALLLLPRVLNTMAALYPELTSK